MNFHFLDRYQTAILGIVRIGLGLLFMQHGAQKLFGWLGGVDGQGQTAQLFSQFGLAGVLEFFGGLLIVAGLLTRPLALLLAAQMAVAYFQAHAPQGGFPLQNGGELALLFLFSFLAIAAAGPGRWALDGRLGGLPEPAKVGPSTTVPLRRSA